MAYRLILALSIRGVPSPQAAEQEVSSRWGSKVSSVFTVLPIACIPAWDLPPVISAAAWDSHRRVNPNPKVKLEYPEIRQRIEIKFTINVMHLKHPETIPHLPWPMEKLFSMKQVPDTKKVGDHQSIRSVPSLLCSGTTLGLAVLYHPLNSLPNLKSPYIIQ